MNAIPYKNPIQSRMKTSQTLLITRICFPQKNDHILAPQLIQPINKQGNLQQQKIITRKDNKHIQNKFFQVQSHVTNLFKICNLEDIYQPNFQKILNENSHNTLRRFSTKIIKNQGSLTKRCENQARIRSYSTEIQTNRTKNVYEKSPIKKVRFYEKVECWQLDQANDIDCNYRYFEPIKLK
ncbi:unnamed protein product [Paramecium sonneborni]|uniref:Uncharacterized protein n=1 Tax=Paramecium sonneborni TaxID=65129 RepID=A0A8S1NVD7_9CILI|nr:unnamed protein product [Paramecium sonneborni]